MGPKTLAIVVLVVVLVLCVCCGVTELVLWSVVTPWIRYTAELWVRYFTLLFAAVTGISTFYLAWVPSNPGFHFPSHPAGCGTCRGCLTHGTNCDEDPVPRRSPGPALPVVSDAANNAPQPMTVFLMDFKNLAKVDCLTPQLTRRGILGLDELECLCDRSRNRTERITRLLCMVSRLGWAGVEGMVSSLLEETEHVGHKELAAILKRNYYETESTEVHSESQGDEQVESSVTEQQEMPTQQGPGMHIVGSCSFSVPDRKSYRFEWKDYGIILQVQEGTVTDGNPVQLHISVCLSGQLNIPSEFDLVSAVYHISSSGKPAKPVYLEIQHCANIRNKKDLTCLTFVGAHSTGSLPYNFRSLKGIEECFSECSTYGLISLPSAQHGLVAIARQRVKRSSLISLLHLSTEVTCKYRLHVFYAAGEESEWIAHLVITRDHKPLLKLLMKEYYYSDELLMPGPNQEVFFEKEAIIPAIPEEGVALSSGWKIMPPANPGIQKQKVDSLTELGHLALTLRWMGPKDSEPPFLDYKVDLKGAKKPANFWMHFKPTSLDTYCKPLHTGYE